MKGHSNDTPLALAVVRQNSQLSLNDRRRRTFAVLGAGRTANVLPRLGGRS
jgi:hypothetical protein